MKFYYFPDSKNLRNKWFHRLIFPLHKVFTILFTIGFLGYFLVVSGIFFFNLISANLVNRDKLQWCESWLEENEKYNVVYFSSLNDVKESFLATLPIEKARGYASSLGGCLYQSKTNNDRAWVSSNESIDIYELKYFSEPQELFLEYLGYFGICLIIYLFLATIPGLVYKYILYVVYGDKLKELIKKQ